MTKKLENKAFLTVKWIRFYKIYRGDKMLDKEKALGAALSQIERTFGKGSIMRLGQCDKWTVESMVLFGIHLFAKEELNLIGISFNKTMEKAFPSKNEQEAIKIGKKNITMLFQRRNEIAHQNDRSHASAEQTDITKEFVEDYISKIEAIVNAIQEIAEETDA